MKTLSCLMLFAVSIIGWSDLQANNDTVRVNISDIDIEVGKTTYDVSLTVENFKDLVSFSYTLSWNPTQFEFNDIMKMHDALEFDFNMDITDEGLLPILWFDVRLDGRTLQEGDTLLTIRYDLLEDPCSGEAFTITDEPTKVTFLDLDNAMPFHIKAGDVNNPLCLSTDVLELEEDSYQIFPNPSFGQVRVRAKQRVELIEIFDFTGLKLATFAGTDTFYYGATGAFVVRVHTRKGVGQKRLILW